MFINDISVNILKTKGYKESSIKTLDFNIKRIFKALDIDYNVLRFKTDAQKIIDIIKSYPEKQQKAYIYAVKLIYDNLQAKFKSEAATKLYNDYYEKVSEEYVNLLTMQEATSQQLIRQVSPEEFNEVYEYYKTIYDVNKITDDENYTDSMKYLIISLYKYIPPLRPQVYLNSTFEEYEETYPDLNVIDLDSKTILIKSAKTLKRGKTQIIQIPNVLISLISAIHDKYNTVYLITKLSNVNEPMTHDNFSHIFSRMFLDVIGREISPNNIRNSFVSDLIDEKGLRTTDERKKIAKLMGHSINTQNNVYSKYSTYVHI
jgi:integrase